MRYRCWRVVWGGFVLPQRYLTPIGAHLRARRMGNRKSSYVAIYVAREGK